MKKKNIKILKLSKKVVSNLQENIKGSGTGAVATGGMKAGAISAMGGACQPVYCYSMDAMDWSCGGACVTRTNYTHTWSGTDPNTDVM
jgi:hypothetical protein